VIVVTLLIAWLLASIGFAWGWSRFMRTIRETDELE